MKGGLILLALAFTVQLFSQEPCNSFSYQQAELAKDPVLSARIRSVENFIQQQSASRVTSRLDGVVIKIPVVVHILYHSPQEKITDAQVVSQIAALNKYFRRRNTDTASAPTHFRALAADCEIEFHLATSDPRRRSTSGITRKYTPVTKWGADDKMKFAAEMGADAWDTKSYLNIWVCNLDKFAGYATLPGTDEKKDGLVINYTAFGTNNGSSVFSLGKTAVHEAGHWLNLRHLWGDEYCGDDGVNDTPKQASYTSGCPSVVRITCGNGPHGDMYMNYMDFTNESCTNMFTEGQKARMRALFENGGPRQSLLSSKGLDLPLFSSIPLPEEPDPKWLRPNLYPNPASTELMLDLSYDIRWIGKTIFVTNMQGQLVMNVSISSKNQRIDVSRLQAGVYFIAAKKDDGESMKLKFVKL
ncbi:MAG: T9SS type A sorting domain-containing protein [Chitinophagaceae bacterium]|nr:T9SS type A sorting domain-containing protein [Chitinophagaceae bacterium]